MKTSKPKATVKKTTCKPAKSTSKPKKKTTSKPQENRRTKFTKIYKENPRGGKNGKTNLATAQGKSGVYLIKENEKIVYIGHSKTNIYRTLMRHFQKWNAKQYVVSFHSKLNKNEYKARLLLCTPDKAMNLEKYLIAKYKPYYNEYIPDLLKFTPQEKRQATKAEKDFEKIMFTPIQEIAPF